MVTEHRHIDLQLVSPDFDSKLMDALMELNHLRRMRLHGSTKPWVFFQLKNIFHLLESVGSARIEGNRTTVSEYIEQRIEHKERSLVRFSEIANIEQAMRFIESNIDAGSKISHHFIRELHQLTVTGLDLEGDRTPGAYRTWTVEITGSSHIPPDPLQVQGHMDELVEFINNDHGKKYDLIKIAIAHHRFAWIHPFGNGNGRVVRLLTYALLIIYGFRVKDGQLINPTAVFCNDREKYYNFLTIADGGTKEEILSWCEYVLTGICDEISKVNRLLDHTYLSTYLLKPAIAQGRDRGVINKVEETVLNMGVEKQSFKAKDLASVLPMLTSRQRTHIIAKLKASGMIMPIQKNKREYFVSFNNNYLMRSLILMLVKESFIPSITE